VTDYVERMKEVYAALSNADAIDQSDVAELAIAVLQEEAKDQRTETIGRQRSAQRSGQQTLQSDDAGTADWRNDPATDAQKKTLENLGVEFDADITKGEASHLIDQAKARQAEA